MRVLPTEKNRQNKFHQNSLKIVAVALERKCRFYISLSWVSGYFGWVLYYEHIIQNTHFQRTG